MGNAFRYSKNWKDEYKRKVTSAESAIAHVKSGDTVVFASGREPQYLGLQLAARRAELRGVNVYIPTPGRDFGWYDAGWEDAFSLHVGFVNAVARQAMQDRRIDFCIKPASPSISHRPFGDIDVYLLEVTAPDERGFCGFGASVWDKRERLAEAKLVLAEVNPSLIRTHGENFVHISQVDLFVENPPPRESRRSSRGLSAEPHVKAIVEQIKALLRDGDTIQIGAGTVSEWIPELGALDNFVDLGLHSEITPRGIVRLVREGVITGKHKTLHAGKVVVTACGGAREDMEFIHGNSLFELHSMYHTHDIRAIAAHDNMVAMNGALCVDLTGQVTAESLGPRMYSGPGGQPAFAIGAMLSHGGRSIHVLPSVTTDGRSRIVSQLPPGTIVTVPRTFSDIVITEYGTAKLRDATQRQRAERLIAIAHPEHRAELGKQAQEMYWS